MYILAGLLITKIIKILCMDLNLDRKCVLIKAILNILWHLLIHVLSKYYYDKNQGLSENNLTQFFRKKFVDVFILFD